MPCSLCGAPSVNRRTCPFNPKAKRKSNEHYDKLLKKSVKQRRKPKKSRNDGGKKVEEDGDQLIPSEITRDRGYRWKKIKQRSHRVVYYRAKKCKPHYRTSLVTMSEFTDEDHPVALSTGECFSLDDLIHAWNAKISIIDRQAPHVIVGVLVDPYTNQIMHPSDIRELLNQAIKLKLIKKESLLVKIINHPAYPEVVEVVQNQIDSESYYLKLSHDRDRWHHRDYMLANAMESIYQKYNLPHNGYRLYCHLTSSQTSQVMPHLILSSLTRSFGYTFNNETWKKSNKSCASNRSKQGATVCYRGFSILYRPETSTKSKDRCGSGYYRINGRIKYGKLIDSRSSPDL